VIFHSTFHKELIIHQAKSKREQSGTRLHLSPKPLSNPSSAESVAFDPCVMVLLGETQNPDFISVKLVHLSALSIVRLSM